MLSRIRTLAIIASCICACSSETSQTGNRVDSATTVALPATEAPASNATSPPAVETLRRAADTDIPATFVVTTPWVDARDVIDTSASAPGFQCVPRSFTDADTLTLRIAVPHGDWLSVKRPDETIFYLVAPGAGTAPNYSIVPSEAFRDMSMIRFQGGIISRPGSGGSGAMTPIFTQSGKYEFLVGNNLASASPHDVRECTIRLVPLSRY
jgi:hypothetical protein